jgi:ferredoxin
VRREGALIDRLLDKRQGIAALSSVMADKTQKWPENAPGKFYVDNQCIDCDLCRETAPAFFTRNEDGGYSYVHKQPVTEEEKALCMEALEGCPVEAIGNDGDDAPAAAETAGLHEPRETKAP